MRLNLCRGLLLASVLAPAPLSAQGNEALQTSWAGAPPSFPYKDERAVPIDIQSIHVAYRFDVMQQRAKARASISFRMGERGYPFFDLVASPSSINLDGNAIDRDLSLAAINDPDRQTRLRVLSWALEAETEHTLNLEFTLSQEQVTFFGDAVRVGFFMDDLMTGGRGFFEQYGPASFEFDQVAYSFDVEVSGSAKPHVVYSNGAVASAGPNRWHIDYPSYFTTSSLYFHLAEEGHFASASYDYQGVATTIPVTVYAESRRLVDQGLLKARAVLEENEASFGPFAHERLVIYVTSGDGGMEYCGATMTSLLALRHELTHSWFARGVMPANGNAGWIDEAIASWSDRGFPRASGAPNRNPVNLGGYSPYKRETTQLAYSKGSEFLSELDWLFAAQGGLRPLLKDLFAVAKRQTITVQTFQNHLESRSATTLQQLFDRYVYGKGVTTQQENPAQEKPDHFHPRRYTRKELVSLR